MPKSDLELYAYHLRVTHKRECLQRANQDDLFRKNRIHRASQIKPLTPEQRRTVNDILSDIKSDGLLLQMKMIMES